LIAKSIPTVSQEAATGMSGCRSFRFDRPFEETFPMPDLQDGQSVEIQGSARLPYILKNIGGVYSCSCPAWRNQSLPIERPRFGGHEPD
jgi:hypothetical protein